MPHNMASTSCGWTRRALSTQRNGPGKSLAAPNIGLAAISAGRDPLLITASGPDDPAIGALNAAIKASGATTAMVNDRIGEGLGHALDQILQTAQLERAMVAGGDTSGHALQAMGIYALTAIAPLA